MVGAIIVNLGARVRWQCKTLHTICDNSVTVIMSEIIILFRSLLYIIGAILLLKTKTHQPIPLTFCSSPTATVKLKDDAPPTDFNFQPSKVNLKINRLNNVKIETLR